MTCHRFSRRGEKQGNKASASGAGSVFVGPKCRPVIRIHQVSGEVLRPDRARSCSVRLEVNLEHTFS